MTHRFLPHTADIRVEITADTLEHVVQEAVAVVRGLLVGGSPVEPRERRDIRVAAEDDADLLFRVVREVLNEFQVDGFVTAAMETGQIERETDGVLLLAGALRGERFDPVRHEAQPEVKAVTRHGLFVRPAAAGVRAELLFDV